MTERPLRVSVGAGEGSGDVFLIPSGRGKDPTGALGRPMPGCVADVQLRLMSWKPAC